MPLAAFPANLVLLTGAQAFWKDSLLPAMLMYAEETLPGDDDDPNGKNACIYAWLYNICVCIYA